MKHWLARMMSKEKNANTADKLIIDNSPGVIRMCISLSNQEGHTLVASRTGWAPRD